MTTVQQRKGRIGSSDAPVIVGVSPYANTSEVRIQQRILGIEFEERSTEATAAGVAMEEGIAQLWSERMDRPLMTQDRMSQHPEHSMLTAHPDRIVDGGDILECKLVGYSMARDWPDDGDSANVPPHVGIQVLHQLACDPEAERAHIAALLGTELRCYTVERDHDAIVELIELELAWWERHIVRGEPCVATTVEEARMVWQPPDKSSAIETAHADDVARLVELTAQSKAMEAEIEAIKVRLCEEMGSDHDALSIDGKEVVRWRPSSSFAAARFCEEQPEIAAQFRKPAQLDATALKKARPDLHKAYSRPGSRRFTITKHAQELTK